MPNSKIMDEMRPKGKGRSVLKELASTSGAYIIVSAKGSTADGPLQDRRKVMRKAVKGVRGASKLLLDFYDREHVADLGWSKNYEKKAFKSDITGLDG